MMRSMYSAVSGLRIHQSKMDTIGNNIANVNTVGFKKGQVTFQEVFSQVVRGASAPTGGKGGTNPQQIGMGAAMGSINTIHTKGPGQRTDNPTDLMIDGEGFFVVSDDANNNNKYYTRAGNFSLDRDGNLVTADGLRVLGYAADYNGNIGTDVTNIRINMSETKAPTATENIFFRGNLNSNTAQGGEPHIIDTVIRDSLGNSYKVNFNLVRRSDTTADVPIDGGGTVSKKFQNWELVVSSIINQGTNKEATLPDRIFKSGDDELASVRLVFDDKGELVEFGPVGDYTSLPGGKLDIGLNLEGLSFEGAPPSGTFYDYITLFDPNNPKTFEDLHQFANEMDVKPYAQDGNTSGTLEGFAIDATGTVTGVFTNGERKDLGRIMLAKFDNPMGLQKLGGNLFVDTRNSGEPQYGGAAVSGFGAISPGNLEMSNVDISLEFTEMITTQRGFQANSRIITTSDEMLQELVNMKR